MSECQCFPADGEKQLLSPSLEPQLPAGHQEGRQEQVSPLLASSAGSHRVFMCGFRGYCSDSGMVLSTWAASGAAAGEPKNALV